MAGAKELSEDALALFAYYEAFDYAPNPHEVVEDAIKKGWPFILITLPRDQRADLSPRELRAVIAATAQRFKANGYNVTRLSNTPTYKVAW